MCMWKAYNLMGNFICLGGTKGQSRNLPWEDRLKPTVCSVSDGKPAGSGTGLCLWIRWEAATVGLRALKAYPSCRMYKENMVPVTVFLGNTLVLVLQIGSRFQWQMLCGESVHMSFLPLFFPFRITSPFRKAIKCKWVKKRNHTIRTTQT